MKQKPFIGGDWSARLDRWMELVTMRDRFFDVSDIWTEFRAPDEPPYITVIYETTLPDDKVPP